jgi:hypothetical protein
MGAGRELRLKENCSLGSADGGCSAALGISQEVCHLNVGLAAFAV